MTGPVLTLSGVSRERLGEWLRGLRWYVREISGDAAYDRYVARHRREHPDEPPLGVRTWWRQRLDGQEGVPPQRCC